MVVLLTEPLEHSAPAVRAAAAAFRRAQSAAKVRAIVAAMSEIDPEEGRPPLLPMVRLLTEDAISVQRNPDTGEPEVLMRAGHKRGDFDTLPLADAIELEVAMLIEEELPLFDD